MVGNPAAWAANCTMLLPAGLVCPAALGVFAGQDTGILYGFI